MRMTTDRSQPSQTCKVILLGDSGAGKTALLRRYVDKTFNDTNQFGGTIGVDYRRVDLRGVRLQVWDTAGEERFRCITNMYLREVDVCLIVFSLKERSSAKNVAYWAKLVRDQSPEARVIVVGNQADVSDSCNENWGFWDGISSAIHFPSTEFPEYHAVSAKTGSGVQELFNYVVHVCEQRVDGGASSTVGAIEEGDDGTSSLPPPPPPPPSHDSFEVVNLPPLKQQPQCKTSCCF